MTAGITPLTPPTMVLNAFDLISKAMHLRLKLFKIQLYRIQKKSLTLAIILERLEQLMQANDSLLIGHGLFILSIFAKMWDITGTVSDHYQIFLRTSSHPALTNKDKDNNIKKP
ncbi:hypothetical protein CEXT_59531 [Caerostris extrusa]|uniref:Uncharacterized protein n=1 Tax=Caerostris extrusa TaxID=172846 RepID=A0AAV4SXW5_CAEEX|nr:hypothetical protein CEXT_59531 [Caerostris extrusa]